MNPLWLGSGGCPAVEVSAAIYSLACDMAGFSEFGTQSSPPVYYRKYSTSGGWTATLTESGHPTWTQVGGGVGLSNFGFDDVTGVLTLDPGDGSIFDVTIVITNPDNESGGSTSNRLIGGEVTDILSTDIATPSGVSSVASDVVAQLSGEFPPTCVVLSLTQFRLVQMAQADGSYSVSAGNFDFTLSDPDDDDAAVTRALNAFTTAGFSPTTIGPVGPAVADVFSANIYSLYEAREGGAFLNQQGSYWLNCANVMPGVLYRTVIVWEGRTAAGDGSGDTSGYGTTWTNTDSQSFNFRPTSPTFATDPVAMPIAAGYQKRIKSISVTPIAG